MMRAIFLDRDGIVNKEIGNYILRFEEFEILPNLIPFMKEAKKQGYIFIIITNQAGIAKGLYGPELVDRCHDFLAEKLAEHQLNFEEMYYCPHFPEYGECLCRKPKSLLVEKGLARFKLNPKNCIMIGDKQRDVDAAMGAGIRGFLLPPNPSLEEMLNCLSYA